MTSRPGSVAADSNVLLSAVAGHAARRVFTEAPDVRILTTLFDFFEVEEYLPAFAEKYGLSLGKLRAELPDLPIEVYGEEAYGNHLEEARGIIGSRDRDDVPLLALALALAIPIWSNDKDFENAPVEVFPTAVFLKVLDLPSRPPR